MTAPSENTPKLSRRHTLGVLGAGSAAILGGCGGDDEPDDASAEQIDAPDSGAELPEEDITFRWVDSGDQKAVFFEQYFETYNEAHPNIEVQYDPLPWEEIGQVVPLGIQNDNAHDVFQLPLAVTGAQAVREGWVSPLDDVIPNIKEWKSRFPPGALVEGITMFNGKVYSVPIGSNKRYGTHLLFNVEYMEAAGYDPTSAPLTWDEFRDAAKKITEAGRGQYYGLIIGGGQTNRWADIVGNLAQMAGSGTSPWQGANIDWSTGEFVMTTDQHIAAVELLLAMKEDGTIFPDSVSMNAPEARAAVPQGLAGMILQGPWNIPIWQDESPDFNFQIASQPVPNDGTLVPLSQGPGGGNQYWVFAGSKYKEVAGDMFSYFGSDEGQQAWAEIVGVADPPAFPNAFDNVDLDERSQAAVDLFEEQLRLRPDPLVRNPDAAQVMLQWQTVTPDLGQTIQGIFTGELELTKALQDAEDNYNAQLDRAIEAAQQEGVEIDRDNWVFANWDPNADYTEESYGEL